MMCALPFCPSDRMATNDAGLHLRINDGTVLLWSWFLAESLARVQIQRRVCSSDGNLRSSCFVWTAVHGVMVPFITIVVDSFVASTERKIHVRKYGWQCWFSG